MPPGDSARKKYDRRTSGEDYLRGLKEARVAIATLQERWPAAFPKQGHLVRPLANTIPGRIAESVGWPKNYVRSVLSVWKSRDPYCKAVLRYTNRHDLDGAVTEQAVDDRAREQARLRLTQNRAARARWQAREAAAGKGNGGNEAPAQGTIESEGESIPGRCESQARAGAADLTENDVDRLVKQAQQEVEPRIG
jgi:sRNA-binding protein